MDSITAARPACPFPGLRPFWRQEAVLFFGRTREVAELRAALLGEHRFVAVIGTSGCGKSSLVEAGLLPRLLAEGGAGGRPWRVISLRPLGAPIAQLAEALTAFARAEQPETLGRLHATMLSSRFRATLRRTTDGLVDVVRETLADPSAPVLVFVDQFEELFRYEPDETDEDLPLFRDEAQVFANLLLGAVRAAAPPIHVLVTMRSDFFGECGRYRGLAEAVSASQFLVPRMVREQLQEAITGPLCVAAGIPRERWPEVLEPALLQRLLNAAGDEALADPLPVMQHALMRAWQMAEHARPEGERAAPLLRVADYVAAGEIAGALSRHADEVLERATAADPALPPDGVAHLFRALTDIDREGRAVRRPQTLAELAPVVGASVAALKPVLDAFRAPGTCFLTPYHPAPVEEATPIDISHEALIRRWRRIADQSVDADTGQPRGWVQQEFRDGLVWRALAVQAEAFGRNREACLDPATTKRRYPWFRTLRRRPAWALRYAIRSERRTAPDAAPEWLAVRELFLHSLRRKRDEQRAQRAATVEANRRAAVENQRAATERRWRQLAVGAAVIMMVLSGIAGRKAYDAWQARNFANQLAQQALEARDFNGRLWTLTGRAQLAADGAVGSVLVSLVFFEVSHQTEIEKLAYAGLQRLRERRAWTSGGSQVGSVWFTPDGALSAVTGDGSIWTWSDGGFGTLLPKQDLGQQGIFRARSSADGGRILVSSFRGGAVLRQVDGHLRQEWPADGFAPELGPGVLSGDGRLALVSNRGQPPALWDVETKQRLWPINKEDNITESFGVAISSNEAYFAVSQNRQVQIRSTKAPYEQQRLLDMGDACPRKQLFSLAFNPRDSDMLLGTGPDGCVLVWRKGETHPVRLMGHRALVFEGTFSPDGTWIATAGEDRAVRLWKVAELLAHGAEAQSYEVRGHSSSVFSVAFSRDGHRFASGSSDATVRVWDIDPALPERTEASFRSIGQDTSATFRPGGKQGDNLTLRVEKPDGFTIDVKVPYDFGEPSLAAVSGDHRYVLVAPKEGRPLLYRVTEAQSPLQEGVIEFPIAELGELRRKWDELFFDGGDGSKPAAISDSVAYFWTIFDDKNKMKEFAMKRLPLRDGKPAELSVDRRCLFGFEKAEVCTGLPKDNSN